MRAYPTLSESEIELVNQYNRGLKWPKLGFSKDIKYIDPYVIAVARDAQGFYFIRTSTLQKI